MRKKIDLNTWHRKEHFEFFSQFDEPFHGITVEMNCTRSYRESKEEGVSFFLNYLHKSLRAANSVPAFRLRVVNEEIFEYDTVHASPTIPREDGSFGFSYINYDPDFEIFQSTATKEIARVKAEKGLDPAVSGENVIHYSSLPWLKFTSLSHARSFKFQDSCPKISFGKMTQRGEEYFMPMSVHTHHGLVDGSHVGAYVAALEKIL